MVRGDVLHIVAELEAETHTRACHDTWRELAAVAGLALWAELALYTEQGEDLRCAEEQKDWWMAYLRTAIGWEAPDGE